MRHNLGEPGGAAPQSPGTEMPLSQRCRSAAQLAGVLLAITAVTLPAPAGSEVRVIGADDRQVIDSSDPPWVSVGRVNRSGRAFCTGILIAPDKVLTAAHCVYDSILGQWAPANEIHFLAGYTRGEYVDHAMAASYAVADGYDRNHGREMATMLRDWAIITLDHPMTVAATPIWPLAFEDLVPALASGTLLQAGYSGDHPHMLSVHEDCDLVGLSGGSPLFYHQCDAIEGDSGSPLLLRIDGRYGVVGLHIAQGVSEGMELGLAIPSSAFAASIRNWVGEGAVAPPPL